MSSTARNVMVWLVSQHEEGVRQHNIEYIFRKKPFRIQFNSVMSAPSKPVFKPQDTCDTPSDVTIIVEDGKEFQAHKHILADASRFFDKLLSTEMRESKEGVVRLQMLTESVLGGVLLKGGPRPASHGPPHGPRPTAHGPRPGGPRPTLQFAAHGPAARGPGNIYNFFTSTSRWWILNASFAHFFF